MKTLLRYVAPLAAAGAVAALVGAPVAAATPEPDQPNETATEQANKAAAEKANQLPANQLLPRCVNVGGGGNDWMSGITTECATVGNTQITTTPGHYGGEFGYGGFGYGGFLW